MKYITFIAVLLLFIACGNETKQPSTLNLDGNSKTIDSLPAKTLKFVDPTKSMSNEELRAYDSLFHIKYSGFLSDWKTKYEDSLNCEIIFHTARDGYALCINFINFTDSNLLSANLDNIIFNISNEEFSRIEHPMRFIHTRRLMEYPEESIYQLRFSGALYQHYEFTEE